MLRQESKRRKEEEEKEQLTNLDEKHVGLHVDEAVFVDDDAHVGTNVFLGEVGEGHEEDAVFRQILGLLQNHLVVLVPLDDHLLVHRQSEDRTL